MPHAPPSLIRPLWSYSTLLVWVMFSNAHCPSVGTLREFSIYITFERCTKEAEAYMAKSLDANNPPLVDPTHLTSLDGWLGLCDWCNQVDCCMHFVFSERETSQAIRCSVVTSASRLTGLGHCMSPATKANSARFVMRVLSCS